MSEEALTLRVITPEGIALDTSAAIVRLPASDGSMGVLKNHAPMVSALGTGLLTYVHGETAYVGKDVDNEFFVSGGFAEVRENTVRVVTEVTERVADIDVDRARAAAERAKKRLMERHPDLDVQRAELALRRAMMRMRLRDRFAK